MRPCELLLVWIKIAFLSKVSSSLSFMGLMDFVQTRTSCHLYPKVVIETKCPDHFATKAEFLIVEFAFLCFFPNARTGEKLLTHEQVASGHPEILFTL